MSEPSVRSEMSRIGAGRPKLKANTSISYSSGPFGLFLNQRYVGNARLDNRYTDETIDDNKVGAQWYTDLNLRYALDSDARYELLGGVQNVFDNTPPVAASSFLISIGVNGILHDVIGRSFYAGPRFRF